MTTGDEIDWSRVRRVLVVRLRSIGDTVLITPALDALRRAMSAAARIDVLLEDWVAPVLDGFDAVDDVLSFDARSKRDRFRIAREIRRRGYDVAINLHGGTTSTFFVRISGAAHRVGYSHYRFGFVYNHRLTSSSDFWGRTVTHSAEQHLALLGAFGVPVDDLPKTRLAVADQAVASTDSSLSPQSGIHDPKSKIALFHPVAAFDTKEWSAARFAEVADFLGAKGFEIVAVGAPHEREKVERLKALSKVSVVTFCDLSLPEITALAARSSVFVGNDSGIAHIAAAVGCPSVVIFGSSNRDHWRPWTVAPHRVVFEPFDCQPCAGYRCEKFDSPRCIESVGVESVFDAVDEVTGNA
jgi:lipopolysaccharide heptosyltransferase II